VRVLEILKALEFYSAFSRTVRFWKINAGPGNSCNIVFFKNSCLQFFGLLLRKGLLLHLLCYESWKSPGKLFLIKGKNAVITFTQNSNRR